MFSFFLRSELVTTNLLQFIKFLSRTQSLFSKAKIGSCRREPSDYTMCAANQACISTHRQARIYRTMQPAAYQPIVTPYMPDSSKAGSNNDQTEWPALRQSVKQGSSKSFLLHSTLVPAVQAHGQTILSPFAANVQGHTDKKRDCEFFRSLFFTYRYACANRWAHTPSPLSQKSKQYTYESVSTQSPGYIASGCGFCTVFSSTILFCRTSNTVAP